jgi:hypothetical protein
VRFVLDENMSVAVVAVLAQRGHEVLHVRDHLALGAPDVEVADLVDRGEHPLTHPVTASPIEGSIRPGPQSPVSPIEGSTRPGPQSPVSPSRE